MKYLGAQLEQNLRGAITHVRNPSHEYTVTVEGRLYGPFVHNVPDLEIVIYYHAEWGFSEAELDQLAGLMRGYVKDVLQRVHASTTSVKIRFYMLSGYKGVDLE